MALQITNQSIKGLYGEVLTSAYVRVEPMLIKTGDKVSYELYYYRDKDSFLAGGLPIKKNDAFIIEYGVTNDGHILYGLHQLLVAHLLTLTANDSDLNVVPVYDAGDLSIVDVDAPLG